MMNVFRFQDIKLRRSSANRTLVLKTLNIILFFQKSTGKYTALTASTTKLQRVGKMSLSNCKKHCAVGNTPKVPLSHNGQYFQSPYKKEPLNPRKSEDGDRNKKRERKDHLCSISSSSAYKIVYIQLIKKHFICKLIYSNSSYFVFLEGSSFDLYPREG